MQNHGRSWRFQYRNETRGNTRQYCNPGCSIDPQSTLTQALHQVINAPRVDPANAGSLEELRQFTRRQNERLADERREVCAAPQDVRVLGIPFHARFADVMVRADYYMKRLSNGTVQLDIDGFYSHMDLWIAAVRNDPDDNRASTFTTRFWFNPGDVSRATLEGLGPGQILISLIVAIMTFPAVYKQAGFNVQPPRPMQLFIAFQYGFF